MAAPLSDPVVFDTATIDRGNAGTITVSKQNYLLQFGGIDYLWERVNCFSCHIIKWTRQVCWV